MGLWQNWETDWQRQTGRVGSSKESREREICICQLFLPSFPPFFPIWLSQHLQNPLHHVMPYVIWQSIIQDDLSPCFGDLQRLRRHFYGHKSNLKTPASWALDTFRIIYDLEVTLKLWFMIKFIVKKHSTLPGFLMHFYMFNDYEVILGNTKRTIYVF